MKSTPPHIALKFLRWFCREDYLDEVEGDLVEVYENQYQKNPAKAKWQFIWTVLRHFRPDFIKAFKLGQNSTTMFKHNLLITYRNFQREKISFLINLMGLSTGLACALLIYFWVSDELNVDQFHVKDEQIFQIMSKWHTGNNIDVSSQTPWPLAEALVTEIPEVEMAVGVNQGVSMNWLSVDDKIFKSKGIYTQKDLFKIFSFNLIEGNEETVLSDKSGIVISKELALKLFGTSENVIGKSISFDRKEEFLVSGIFDHIPSTSTIKFDFVLLNTVFERHYPSWELAWDNNFTNTYILLHEGADVDRFNKSIENLTKKKADSDSQTLFSRQFSKGYLYDNYQNGIQSGGRIEYVKLFSLIGAFILIIACINYMNLSTALASERSKEVAMRKTMGAKRMSLVFQYISESTIITFVSLSVSWLLVFLLLPFFNELANKQISLNFNIEIILLSLVVTLLTGLAAGAYPAFHISGFNPIMALKSKSSSTFSGLLIRKGLVVFQFALSVLLIVAVLVVYKQFELIQNGQMGYNKDHIISFDLEGKVKTNRETFLTEVKKVPGVLQASSISKYNSFFGINDFTWWLWWPGKTPNSKEIMHYRIVDYGMMELLGMEMKEGRFFSKNLGSDESKIIFNEAAIKYMGLENPIGTQVEALGRKVEILGVVKDFHFESLHSYVKPMFMLLDAEELNTVMLKVNNDRLIKTLSNLNEMYSELNPGFPLTYEFLNNDFQKMYASEKTVSILSRYFAGLAILISSLGLFGLAVFTTEKRLKEISIRKVLGAKDFDIVILLSNHFTKTVLVAIIIALPLSYLLASRWLESFAFRVDLEWWYFISAGSIVILIAWLTIGLQMIKTINVNPSDSLKNE